MMLSKFRMLSGRTFFASNKLGARQFTSSNGKEELNVTEEIVKIHGKYGDLLIIRH